MPTNQIFPNWISAYIDLFDPYTEAPTHLHFWTAVSTIAGALTRRVFLDEDTFRLYPNFCIIMVAPPGTVTKTTTISHGHALLKEIPGINFAADNTSYPMLVQRLASYISEFRESINGDRLSDEWTTQCAITASISELGTFLRTEDEDAVNGLTDLLDCKVGTMTKDTKTAGTDIIENPFVNIIGGTTPSWVQDKLNASIAGWGLSSRIIFVFADKKKQYIHRPSTLVINRQQYAKRKQFLIDDLKMIAQLTGRFSYSPAADAALKAWYDESCRRHEEYNKSADRNEWVSYFLARKSVQANKLAMVLNVARGPNLYISIDDMTQAITQIDQIEQQVIEVFRPKAVATAFAVNEQAILDRIVTEVQQHGSILKSAALSRATRFVDSATAVRLIDNAIHRKVLLLRVDEGQAWISVPIEPTPAAPSPPNGSGP